MTDDRIAIVTGASSGIGRAVAACFSRTGIRVVVTGRDEGELVKLASELSGERGAVVPFASDMTQPRHTETLLAVAERAWGPASIFVASAGRGLPGTVLGSDAAQWQELMEVNYLAIARQLRACAAEFRRHAQADAGQQVRDIVVIGSSVGRQVSAANPVYGSTKFAVHSLVEALRQEVCTHNIRVSLIEPGFVRSGFQEAAGYDMTWFESVARESGPLLTPDDVAETVEFVVSRPKRVHLDDIRLRPTRQRA